MPESKFLELLKTKTVLLDGAMGSLLQARDLTSEDFRGKPGCLEILTLTRPDLIEAIHRAYLEAGADAVKTNTFQGSRLKLAEHGFADLTGTINRQAAALGRRAADGAAGTGRPRFVVGSIGPTGKLPSSDDPTLSAPLPLLEEVFSEQAEAIISGGADALLVETQQDILETRAAVFGVREAFRKSGKRLPLLVHVTLDKNGRMLMGTDIGAACAILESLDVDVIGINCSLGPEEMRDFVRALAEGCTRPVGCAPNAGLPENRDGKPFYRLGPGEMAESLTGLAASLGLDLIGGCCGTTPAHIREISRRLHHIEPWKRIVSAAPSAASAFKRVPLRQVPRPLIIGERLNVLGSRKTKELVQSGSMEAIAALASEQELSGCHLLDLCMAGDREKENMVRVVRLLSRTAESPLVIDSTDPEVVEAALAIYPGRAVVNSVSLEKGPDHLRRMLALIHRHGACAVAMTITESGMALQAGEKVEAARRIRETALECRFPTDDLLLDCLTFPLSTGEEKYATSAIETLEGVRAIQSAFPDAVTILGISNVSFGLMPEARRILNSVFLYHALQCGLGAAIVNAKEILPYDEIPAAEKKVCENLLFGRGETALSDLMNFFRKRPAKTNSRETGEKPPESLEDAIRTKILERSGEGIEALLEEALTRLSAREILNTVLLPAMEAVGKKFNCGEMILPFVLQAADVMRRATDFLEPRFAHDEKVRRGKVILATVFGDVHDIGKNLVKSVLANNGYAVRDLGKRVPVHVIVEEARATGADAIGLSALLVSTSQEMRASVLELHRSGLRIPVIIGGAAVHPSFARRIALVERGQPYAGGVFYARDAFHGLEILNGLMEDRDSMLARYREEVLSPRAEAEPPSAARETRPSAPPRRDPIPPPFPGKRSLLEIPPEAVFPHLDLNALFRSRWAARKIDSSVLRETQFLPMLESLKRESVEKRVLHLSAVYGYFPCEAVKDGLIVRSEGRTLRLTFAEDSVLTGFFLPQGSPDLAIPAVVSTGAGPGDLLGTEPDEAISKAFYVHGFLAETADALADYLEQAIRKELALPEGAGRRFSPGYPSWPALSEQQVLFSILRPGEDMEISLTETFQMIPEHSVSFLFCPRA
jgi:5-methyltetrahydrofolate--homocysteine methyltransferase